MASSRESKTAGIFFDMQFLKNSVMKLYSYELDFKKPLLLKGALQKNRKGIIIEILAPGGAKTFGEISPLPFFSHESYGQAFEQIKYIRDEINFQKSPDSKQFLQQIISGKKKLLPSVQAGIDMAGLNLAVLSGKTILNINRYMPVNGLVSFNEKPSDKQIEAEGLRIIKKGYGTIKLKVARLSPDDDLYIAEKLSNIFEQKIRFRFDANCMWSFEDAIYFSSRLSSTGLQSLTDYLEDPLKDDLGLAHLHSITGIGIALDEKKAPAGSAPPFLKTIIIKPTIAGGFSNAIKILDYCKDNNITPVLSSSFETGLGIASISLFGMIFSGPEYAPAGLDTLEWFSSDIIGKKLKIKNGRINAADALRAVRDLDISRLKVIE